MDRPAAFLGRIPVLPFLIVLVAAAGGAGHANAVEPLSSPKDIEGVYEQAMTARDASIVAAYYAEDAKLFLPDGHVADGRRAIQDELQIGYDKSTRSLKRSRITLKGDDAHAVLLWEWALEVVPDVGATTVTDGRSLHYWVKGAEGWQIVYDIYQTY